MATFTPDAIRSLRERLGLTQQALADRLNATGDGLRITQETIARWEGGKFHPSGPAAAVLRRLDGGTSQTMTAAQLVDLVRAGQLQPIIDALTTKPHLTLTEGWDLRGWSFSHVGGALGFVRYADTTPATDPRIVELQGEKRDLERREQETHAASYHDASVRAERDDARNHINAIDHELADSVRDALPIARPPVEAVLLINADPSPRWAAMVDDADYPITILYRDEWASSLPVQPGEVPF